MDRILYYEKQQVLTGLYSLLIVLDFFECTGNYQECHYIKSAIISNNKRFNLNYPTHMRNSDYNYLSNEKKNFYRNEAKKICEHITNMNNLYNKLNPTKK